MQPPIAEPIAENAADHVQDGAPRIIRWTNLTVISLSFLEGALEAIAGVPNVTEQGRDVWCGHCLALQHITVVRVDALLDRAKEDQHFTYQTVYRCLKRPEVVDVLVKRLCDDPSGFPHNENDVRQQIGEFLSAYRAIDWRDLHGRLTHIRNIGIAHLTQQHLDESITQDELQGLVKSVRGLGDHLSLFRRDEALIQDDEIADHAKLAAQMWRAALRRARPKSST
jgi:hypothetical protein